MVYQWINIVILFTVLTIVLRKKLGAYFASQRAALESDMTSAGAKYELMKKEYEEMERSVVALDSKLKELADFSLKEIEVETKKIEAETAKSIQKILVDGEARIKNEAERMKRGLEKELFQSALVLAKESLQKGSQELNQDWVAQIVQPEATAGKKNYAS
jgi:F0F1-type ATP synthase membrane subunit b/b'